ncbi:MAG: hypothetical protein JNL01_15600 [Bdellovibrionales bacterium]|nr:hypothetical protein [Bdellovibrionales bacterium]
MTMCFDIDDNLLFLPTKISIFKKVGADPALENEIRVSTHDFALIREQLGRPGKYEQYETRKTPETSSFRTFSDAGDGPGGRNYILEDVKEMIEGGTFDANVGPAWKSFVYAMQSEEAAKHVCFATARSHHPQEVLEMLEYLVSKGKISRTPLQKNLHCVGGAENPSAEKAKVFREMLAKLEAQPVPNTWPKIRKPSGTGKAAYHLWTFSDDDWGNYEKTRDVIAEDMKAGKYGNIKVMLFFTGLNNPKHAPEAIVLDGQGGWRPIERNEEQDVARMLKVQGFDCDELLRFDPRANAPGH